MKQEKKGGFLSMLLGTLGASLLGNMLTCKEINRVGEVFIKACYGSKRTFRNQGFLIPPHSLTNFEIQKYYQNEPRFNGVYFRDNLLNKIRIGHM